MKIDGPGSAGFKIAWAAALVLSALTLGLTFAHVLELPQRLRYDAGLWTNLTRPNAVYRYFGIVGGPLEIAAVLSTAVIATVLRRAQSAGTAARLGLAAALLHAAALAIWLAVVAPANVEIGRWSASGIPADWEQWRMRWETGHAASFVVLLFGFSTLVAALLVQYASGRAEEERHDVRTGQRLGSKGRSREP